MKANDPRYWGKSPQPMTVDELVETSLATASKFIDESPLTALMCLMGTQGNFDSNVYRQAAERIKTRLSTIAES